MHNPGASPIVPFSFAGCLLLEVSAVAILLLACRYSYLRSIGGTLRALASKAILALPGVVLASLLVEKMNLVHLQPYLYVVGATSSCVFLELYLYLDRVA